MLSGILRKQARITKKRGTKRVVAHTFSPFGPILPGSPGGPYTTKKQRKYISDQGRTGGEGGRNARKLLEHASSNSILYADSGLQKPHEGPSCAHQPSLLFCVLPLLASQGCVSSGPKVAMLVSTLCEFNFLPGILGLPETS